MSKSAVTLVNTHKDTLTSGRLTWAGTALVINAGDPALTPYQEIARYTLPAGVAVALGNGHYTAQDSATGRIYMDIRDNTASPGVVQNGTIRIEIQDPTQMPQGVIYEARTEQLRVSTDPRQQQVFEARPPNIGQNWSFVILLKPDAAFTPGSTNITTLMDITMSTARLT